MIAKIEYTDLYGGESNYSWVTRHEFNCEGMSNRAIVRRAKNLLDLQGVKSLHGWDGEDIARYFKSTVMFISFEDC